MSHGAEPSGASASYRLVRELGKRAQRSWAAIRERGELVVVQRFTKAPKTSTDRAHDTSGATFVAPDTMALLLRDARCLAKNWHPNIARVRHVDLVGSELYIATELVDGVTLADLLALARAKRSSDKEPVLAFPLLARVIVDVLGGLHGLHGLRDGINTPLEAFHGELCPANIVIGKDGVARVANVFRPRPVKVEARSEALGYASPEALAGEAKQDGRADVYAVGTILWEGLTGRRLHDDREPARVAQRQREEELARPEVPASSPFARLADAALRALSFDPALRFRTASEMATEIRRITGTRLAPGSAIAQTVMELAGDRIRARRAELDPSSTGSRRATSIPPLARVSVPPPTRRAGQAAPAPAADPPAKALAPKAAAKVPAPAPKAPVPRAAALPLTFPKAAATTAGPFSAPNADANAMIAASEIVVAEKSLSVAPPPAAPAAAAPVEAAAHPEPSPEEAAPASERFELESTDYLEIALPADSSPDDSSRDVAALAAARDSNGAPVAVLSLGPSKPDKSDRRRKLVPVVIAVSALAVLLLVFAAVAALRGSGESDGSAAGTSPTSRTGKHAPADNARAAAAAPAAPNTTEPPREVEPAAPVAAAPAEEAPPEADQPTDPGEEPAAPSEDPGSAPAGAGAGAGAGQPRPPPPGAAPRKPKKSSYEPLGI